MQTRPESTGMIPREPKGCPVAWRAALDEASKSAAAIERWLVSRDADRFPYDAVVAEFQRVGKHVAPATLLEVLAGIRAGLASVGGSAESVRVLDRFLDAALDKWDGRYANPTYLALSQLPLPSLDHPGDIAATERRYDRLFVHLIADALRFEVAAADGATDLLPEMRPDDRISAKRCRLGLQAIGPALRRLGLRDGATAADPIAAARALWATLVADLSPSEHRTLQLTMLPVSRIHDEYQFIRILQSYEATFAVVAVQIHAAVRALASGRPEETARRIRAAEATLREAAPLFSLVGTMRVAAFQTFREFTEGASAIQSRNYKLVESLCRQPDPARLDSAAYRATPEIRQRALTGPATLDGVFDAARASGRSSSAEVGDLEGAMRQFATTLRRWRKTHHRLAERMLGERTGTGYTEGSPYLKAAQAIPVFLSIEAGEDAEDSEGQSGKGDEVAPAQTPELAGARGRCPFAAGSAAVAMVVSARV